MPGCPTVDMARYYLSLIRRCTRARILRIYHRTNIAAQDSSSVTGPQAATSVIAISEETFSEAGIVSVSVLDHTMKLKWC
jgi:hypothetical protein